MKCIAFFCYCWDEHFMVSQLTREQTSFGYENILCSSSSSLISSGFCSFICWELISTGILTWRSWQWHCHLRPKSKNIYMSLIILYATFCETHLSDLQFVHNCAVENSCQRHEKTWALRWSELCMCRSRTLTLTWMYCTSPKSQRLQQKRAWLVVFWAYFVF